MNKEVENKISSLCGEIAWWFNGHLPLRVAGKENLAEAKEHLSEGSLLLYFNHPSIVDPGLLLRIIEQHLKNPFQGEVLALTSQKHLDPRRGPATLLHCVIMKSGSVAKGFELLPVVQEYDQHSYPDFFRINRKSLLRAIRSIREPGTILMVAPEETRTKSGVLIEAKNGLETIFVGGKRNVWAMPLAITGAEKLKWLDPNNKSTITAGEPISYEETQLMRTKAQSFGLELSTNDVLMLHLARLLPERYWGFYDKYLQAALSLGLFE